MHFRAETINSIFNSKSTKMRNPQKNVLFLPLLFAVLISSSCTKTKENPDYGKYGEGVLISNEGTFNSGNGTVSYYNTENDSVINDIFKLENGRNLGDVVQSVSRIGDFVFIQVNNSHKIEVVDGKSFAEKAVIKNLTQVRYAIGNEQNAYATAWGKWGADGKVYFIDVKTLKLTDSVSTGLGPEAMLLFNDNLFVANSGGYTYDNTISVINTLNKSIIKTITVGANPKSMVLDKNQKLWVLCSGSEIYDANWNTIGHHASKLLRINPLDFSIEKEIQLFASKHPAKLALNGSGDLLYFGSGFGFTGIYTLNINSISFTENLLINKAFYGFDFNKNTNEIFAFEAPNYTERGKLYRYTADGVELGNYTVGIAPNGSSLKRIIKL